MGTHRRLVGIALGLAFLIVAAGAAIYPFWWQHRQNVAGAREVQHLEHVTRSAPARAVDNGSACASGARPGPGILRIPADHVVAPTEPGVGSAVLAVAVGHYSLSPWPGQAGMAVLESHDVGYFAQNGSLRPGDVITYSSGCRTTTFRVVSTAIEKPGQPIAPLRGRGGLALISCWPTNALWWTPDRLVVRAQDVSSAPNVGATLASVAPPTPVAALPPGVPGGQRWIFSYHLAGTLSLAGTPSRAFVSSPLPLLWERAALDALAAYLQGVRTQAPWLRVLAGGSRPPGWGGLPGSAISVRLSVTGGQVQSVRLSGTTNGHAAHFVVTVKNGYLHVQ